MLPDPQKEMLAFPKNSQAMLPLLSAVGLDSFSKGDGIEQTLADGVKLLCDKLLDLTELCLINDLKLNSVSVNTHVTHKQWQLEIAQVFDKLRLWESKYNTVKIFSKAFDALDTNLKLKRKKRLKRDPSQKQPFQEAHIGPGEVLKNWVMSLEKHNQDEKIRVKRKKVIKVSATPVVPLSNPSLVDPALYKQISPSRLHIQRTTEIYLDRMQIFNQDQKQINQTSASSLEVVKHRYKSPLLKVSDKQLEKSQEHKSDPLLALGVQQVAELANYQKLVRMKKSILTEKLKMIESQEQTVKFQTVQPQQIKTTQRLQRPQKTQAVRLSLNTPAQQVLEITEDQNKRNLPNLTSNRGVWILENETPRLQGGAVFGLSTRDLLSRTQDQIRISRIEQRNPVDSFYDNLSQKINDLSYPSEHSFEQTDSVGPGLKLPKLRYSIGDAKNLAIRLQQKLKRQQPIRQKSLQIAQLKGKDHITEPS